MAQLVKTDEDGSTWYPVPIDNLCNLLEKTIVNGENYSTAYALRKNIAYNLQYLQFQDRILQDIKISGVIHTQSIKTIIITGCGIIESILHYLLIINNVHSTTLWKEKFRFNGNEKKVDGKKIKVDTIMYEKLDKPELKHMSFDSMIKSAKSNDIFGGDAGIHKKLKALKGLRNKVHLQEITSSVDTDWNTFNNDTISDIYEILYAALSGDLFSPTADEQSYFQYLQRPI